LFCFISVMERRRTGSWSFESNESRILPRSHIEVHNFYFRTIFTTTTIISLLYCYNPHQQHISSITTRG
jgi:hypothetical protein